MLQFGNPHEQHLEKTFKTSQYIISYQVNVNVTIVRWRRNECNFHKGTRGEVIAIR